jgi:hypothetical protein
MNPAFFSCIRRRAGMKGLGISVLLSLVILAGCYVYGPPPGPYPYYYGPSTYDRSWNATLDAMRDTGVSIVSTDYNGGIIGNGTASSLSGSRAATGASGGVPHEHSPRIRTGRPDLPEKANGECHKGDPHTKCLPCGRAVRLVSTDWLAERLREKP